MPRTGQHPVTPFTTPVTNARPISSATLRGNFNTLATILTAHDANQTVHVQSGVDADRPAPGVVGRVWVSLESPANPVLTVDNGTAWVSPLVTPAGIAFLDAAQTFTARQIFQSTTALIDLIRIRNSTGNGGILAFHLQTDPAVRTGFVGYAADTVLQLTNENGGNILLRCGTPLSDALRINDTEAFFARGVRARINTNSVAALALEQEIPGGQLFISLWRRDGAGNSWVQRGVIGQALNAMSFTLNPEQSLAGTGFSFSHKLLAPRYDDGNGVLLLDGTAVRTGFGNVSGTLNSTAWNTGTITLADLAQRVGAMWNLLRNIHGLMQP